MNANCHSVSTSSNIHWCKSVLLFFYDIKYPKISRSNLPHRREIRNCQGQKKVGKTKSVTVNTYCIYYAEPIDLNFIGANPITKIFHPHRHCHPSLTRPFLTIFILFTFVLNHARSRIRIDKTKIKISTTTYSFSYTTVSLSSQKSTHKMVVDAKELEANPLIPAKPDYLSGTKVTKDFTIPPK